MQFCFSAWTPMPFKHICGYITLYICVSGHQIILKSLQFTNSQFTWEWTTVSFDWFSIIWLILLPHSFTKLTPVSTRSSIAVAPWYTPIALSSASQLSAVYGWEHPNHIDSFSLSRPQYSSKWPFTTLCKKHCFLRCHCVFLISKYK